MSAAAHRTPIPRMRASVSRACTSAGRRCVSGGRQLARKRLMKSLGPAVVSLGLDENEEEVADEEDAPLRISKVAVRLG